MAASLAGELLLPRSSAYEVSRKLYNPRFDWIRPAAVAFCKNTSDVRECLGFARRYGMPITSRAGGHSYAGWSTGPGLVIDVSRMNQVTVNTASKTANVGAGAKLIDVFDRLATHGLTVPAGSCATVGIAGLTLGGGIGMVGRAYGLTCDNVLSVDLVVADGRVMTCDNERNPDLFWACRGGGGGNFGVATSFTFQAHPARDITRLMLEWQWFRAAKVIQSWQEWAPNAPDEAWSYCQFRTNPEGSTPRVRILIVFLGSQQDLEPLVDNLIAPINAEPNRTVETQSYLQAMLALAGCTTWSVDECHLPQQTPDGKLNRQVYSAKSHFFDRPLSSHAVDSLIHYIEQGHVFSDLIHGGITFDACGGAINRVHSEDTAFVHRSALFNAQYLAFWRESASRGVEDRCMVWLRGFHQTMRPHANGGAYVNYIDPELLGWQKAYYGSNYERLVRVKAQYDPDRLFKLPQGIPPS